MSEEILIGTRKGLFTALRGAAGWRIEGVAFLGVPVTLAMRDPRDGSRYAALEHGHFGAKLQRSQDGGARWQELGTPTYPEKPADREDIDPIRGRPIPWSLRTIWALAAGAADQPGRLYAGTIPGGLFRSDDHGDSWCLVRSLWDHPGRARWLGGGADYPGIHSVCVDPRDARRVILGVSCGGVWISEDDGASWACRADGMRASYLPPEQAGDPGVQDPHRVVQCAARPEVFWAQHHNGIFRSTDDCTSWHEISEAGPSTFGFSVAVDPTDAETAWFVPAVKDEVRVPVDGALVVTRTRDGGASFEVLRAGLPQRHAYDLVFRHALDVSRDGERLAFGSTTGSVFISEDRGDTWQPLSEHLPPVYSVSFA